MAKWLSFGSFIILGGLIVLLLQVTFDFEGSTDYFYQYWWLSIIAIIIGTLINLQFKKERWHFLFSRERLKSALALLFETMIIFYVLKCISATDLLSRVKFFLTAVILFFVVLHWKGEVTKSKVFF